MPLEYSAAETDTARHKSAGGRVKREIIASTPGSSLESRARNGTDTTPIARVRDGEQ